MPDRMNEMTDAVVGGRNLTREEIGGVFDTIMSGGASDEQIARFLSALADKGETPDEIAGAAIVMRRNVTPIACPDANAVDTCGTGGDGISTFNVSTAAAIVAAGAGACVAKHGNRTNTRKSGSAEVLRALGVNIEADTSVVERCLREIGIGFLFAAKLHPAMKYAIAARRQLARQTIFNMLGPLTNPAGVRRQVIGVAQEAMAEKIAVALQELEAVHALVVHGHDGLCDLTITGPSTLVELRNGQLERGVVTPEDVGLSRGPMEALLIDSPEASAAVVRSVLEGKPGPCRDHTLLNAAATLVAAGVADDLRQGVQRATDSIDSGAAMKRLAALVEMTRGEA